MQKLFFPSPKDELHRRQLDGGFKHRIGRCLPDGNPAHGGQDVAIT